MIGVVGSQQDEEDEAGWEGAKEAEQQPLMLDQQGARGKLRSAWEGGPAPPPYEDGSGSGGTGEKQGV